jgi:hypothetical protein
MVSLQTRSGTEHKKYICMLSFYSVVTYEEGLPVQEGGRVMSQQE